MDVIIDSDIGDDITDAISLVYALKSRLNIKAILSNNNHTIARAKIIHKLSNKIPVYSGINKGKGRLTRQKAFKNYNPKIKSIKDNLNFFKKLFKEKIIYISLGTLSNIYYFLKNIPDFENNAKVIMMGGSIKKDYHGKNKKKAEWNIYCDIKSAQNVLKSKLDITMLTLDTTWNLILEEKYIDTITKSKNKMNQKLIELYKIWKQTHRQKVIQYDSPVIAYALKKQLFKTKYYNLDINNKGHIIKGNKNIKVITKIDKTKFQEHFIKTIQ